MIQMNLINCPINRASHYKTTAAFLVNKFFLLQQWSSRILTRPRKNLYKDILYMVRKIIP